MGTRSRIMGPVRRLGADKLVPVRVWGLDVMSRASVELAEASRDVAMLTILMVLELSADAADIVGAPKVRMCYNPVVTESA